MKESIPEDTSPHRTQLYLYDKKGTCLWYWTRRLQRVDVTCSDSVSKYTFEDGNNREPPNFQTPSAKSMPTTGEPATGVCVCTLCDTFSFKVDH